MGDAEPDESQEEREMTTTANKRVFKGHGMVIEKKIRTAKWKNVQDAYSTSPLTWQTAMKLHIFYFTPQLCVFDFCK
jgi:hypothetical protein